MPPYRDRDRGDRDRGYGDRDRDRGFGGRSGGSGGGGGFSRGGSRPPASRAPRPPQIPAEAVEETRVLIEYLAQILVDDAEQVRVRAAGQGASGLVFELSVAPDDMGRIIGKQGRVANAMRALLKATASKLGTRINLEIV